MSALFNPLRDYSGPIGNVKKFDMYRIDSNRLDTQILELNDSVLGALSDQASGIISMAGRTSRHARDYNIDVKNPREELPKDKGSILQMNAIPNLRPQMVDISHPADYEASNAIKLLQESNFNSQQQESMFTDPAALKRNMGESDAKQFQDDQSLTKTQEYMLEGSAAGIQSNRLTTDEDGSYVNSVEAQDAF
jgi:hypothetical protein